MYLDDLELFAQIGGTWSQIWDFKDSLTEKEESVAFLVENPDVFDRATWHTFQFSQPWEPLLCTTEAFFNALQPIACVFEKKTAFN